MGDYARKFDEMKRKLAEAARQASEQYNLEEILDQGVKAAARSLRKGAEVTASGMETARRHWQHLDEEYRLSEAMKRATEEVTEAAKKGARRAEEELQKLDEELDVSHRVKRPAEQVAQAIKRGARRAEEKADELFGEASRYYQRVSRTTNIAGKTAQWGSEVASGLEKAREWVRQNPGQAAVVGLSLIVGVRMGSAFPKLDATILGLGGRGHWVFHSALMAYGLRKIAETYWAHLERQEQLIRAGDLTGAEAARIEFQRNMTRLVGAPLLGAFSVATGMTLIAESLSPGRIIGAPVELILGGNPLLNSIWLFSNGLICLHAGYRFFFLAVADEEAVARWAEEWRRVLPSEAPRS